MFTELILKIIVKNEWVEINACIIKIQLNEGDAFKKKRKINSIFQRTFFEQSNKLLGYPTLTKTY